MKEKEIICKFKIYGYEELADSDRELVDRAKDATRTSYAPYSEFRVGAAARLSDGTIVTGNPYFNCGTCYSCQRGLVNCCVSNETAGVQRDGVFRQYITFRE